jgi:hypothetical protein
VIICLNDPELIKVLMNHFVEKSVAKVVTSFVEVTANEDGRGVAVMAEVPFTTSYSDGYSFEDSAKVLVIELVKPQS